MARIVVVCTAQASAEEGTPQASAEVVLRIGRVHCTSQCRSSAQSDLERCPCCETFDTASSAQ